MDEVVLKLLKGATRVFECLGAGHTESVYENALEVELQDMGLKYGRQVVKELTYRGQTVGSIRADLVVYVPSGGVVVELKATEGSNSGQTVATRQIGSYAKCFGQTFSGLLINFNQRTASLDHSLHSF